MCGIVATVGPVPEQDLLRMQAALRHRGKDASVVRRYGSGAGLGINRLAIIAVEGGHQPFDSAGVHLVCNGEIYNHGSLRADLPPEALVCGSDVAVVAPLYAEHGPAFVEHLDGMFALVLLDERTGSFLAARDRFGIKPLYYARDGDRWWFASEVKAFLGTSADLRRVRLLPPGHVLTPAGLRPYYRLADHRRRSVHDPRLLRALVDAAVGRHLMADEGVGVGVFLSGGLDSSVIAALAAPRRPDLLACSVGMPGSQDVAHADLLCRRLGIEHLTVPFTLDEVWETLPEAVFQLESYNPVIVLEGALQMLLTAHLRARGIAVVLSGEGADEVFSGYGAYRGLSGERMRETLRLSLAAIGNTECHRLDRATMAHSVEARVPFLDPAVVEYGTNLPARDLVRRVEGRLVEKWALRDAFRDVLPPEIAWRRKLPFDHASGVLGLLERFDSAVTDADLAALRSAHPGAGLRSKASAHLFRLFHARFGEAGGDGGFGLFGEYPVLQSLIDDRPPGGQSGLDEDESAEPDPFRRVPRARTATPVAGPQGVPVT